jgi:hypothetical protein
MTPITQNSALTTPDELHAENTRLHLAIAHLLVYARAVLECRENGSLTITPRGPTAYQASSALCALEETVTRILAGDWPVITERAKTQAWERHKKHSFWGGAGMDKDGFIRALNDLLWHPDRRCGIRNPDLPIGGTVGLAGDTATPADGTAGFADHLASANNRYL